MPKMLFSKFRFYDIKDLLSEVKRPKRWVNTRSAGIDFCFLQIDRCGAAAVKEEETLQQTSSFRRFLQSEFSEENLDFWLACEDFRTISSEPELRSRAYEIYQEFLEPTSKREVNVDQSIRDQILGSLDKPSALCFAAAQRHVFTLMEKDSLPRYVLSQKYQSLSSRSRTQWYI
uniref:Si:ch211-117l17.6 n=1 Tax=Neogobius melanostomus TaxID=47308 RepID=A0A8C6WZ67_9GOBI